MEHEELKQLRGEIDRIDEQILALFRQRMETAAAIGRYKAAHGLPTLAAEREQIVLDRAAEQAGEGLSDYARTLFNVLMSLSRAYQDRLAAQGGKKLRCGLVGEKLGHSFSPAIHARLGSYDYRLIELKPEEVEEFFRIRAFDGVNVTIPYKRTVLPLCDELTDAARSIGCVNTVVRRPDGSLLGHNTDYDGFLWLLRSAGAAVKGEKALVLGTGGASLTVQAVLREQGAAEVVVVSRSGDNNYVNLYEKHPDAAILVNATPVGMYPKTGVSPVDLDRLPGLKCVLDVVYNPARTQLLLDAERRGIPCANGLGMLVAQAVAASESFTGQKVDNNIVDIIKSDLEKETRNLLLIGMPGCGKSTLGALLAGQLGRRLVDLDEEIAAEAGCSIPDIFSREGEEGFRLREHRALCRVGAESGLVIAGGGGLVTRPENRDPMRQNSVVIWLQRDLDRLPTDGRPLSQRHTPEELYSAREPLYRAAADIIVDNNGTLEETLRQILEAI